MKKRILVISPTPTHPENAGNRIRINVLLKSLKKNGFEIHFLYEDREYDANHVYSDNDITGMRKSWDYCYYVFNSSFSLSSIFFNMILKTSTYNKNNRHTLKYYLLNKLVYYIVRIDYVMSVLLRKVGLIINFFARHISQFLKIYSPSIYHTITSFRQKYLTNKHASDIDFLNKRTKKYINILKNSFSYDYVLAEYIYTSKTLELFDKKVIKIIDTHDVFSNRNNKYAKWGIKENYMSSSIAEEEKALKRADIIIAIQDQEKKYFQKHTDAKVEVIGHKVRLVKPRIRKRSDNNILFVGSINTSNVHGITQFISNIFPEVLKKIPDAKIMLVGGICKIINDSPEIIKLGEVEDLKNTYAEAKVVINPVIIGTGLKIKCVEAIGFSRPLVATKHALEGLYNQKFFNSKKPAFLIANNDKEFSKHIIKLLSNTNYNNSISYNAYNYAIQYNQQIDNQVKKVFQS